MPYRFKPNETIASGVERIGLEQIERAHTNLTATQAHGVHVHEVRKCFKRLRSLLRLVSPALPGKLFRSENRRFRDLARLLATSRDRHVLRETIVKLEAWQAEGARSTLSALRFLVSIEDLDEPVAISSETMDQALSELKIARKAWTRIELPGDNFDIVGKGLENSYKAGHHAFAAAYASGQDEDFHEWRKYVQQHWRHMQLLRSAWSDYFAARIRETKALSDLLGDDHDLFVLERFVAGLQIETIPAKKAAALSELISFRQQQLRAIARARGDRLYVEGAKGLHARIERYWETGVRIASAEKAATKRK